MDHNELFWAIGAIVTAFGGLIGLFFDRRYWDMLNSLVSRQLELQEAMANLDNHIAASQALLKENQALRQENASLKSKLDRLSRPSPLGQASDQP